PGEDWRRGWAGSCGGLLAQAACGQGHRGHDPIMRAAAAEVPGQRLGDLGAAWVWIAIQQRLGADQDPGQAIAALTGLQLDECGLQRVRLIRRAEPLDRGDSLADEVTDLELARGSLLPIDQHRTGPALAGAAAEAGAFQVRLLTQDVQ